MRERPLHGKEATDGRLTAIDGKTLRSSLDLADALVTNHFNHRR